MKTITKTRKNENTKGHQKTTGSYVCFFVLSRFRAFVISLSYFLVRACLCSGFWIYDFSSAIRIPQSQIKEGIV